MTARYALPAGARLRVLTASARVTITAEERDDLEVDPPRHVETVDGGRIVEVRSRSTSLEIRCPRLTSVSVGSISGHVELRGEFGSVKVSTVSGRIEVDSATGDLDARSVSGHLTVQACGGRCQLNTKSGHVRIGKVEGPAQASSLSGHVEVGTSGQGDVELRSVSGAMTVRVLEPRQPRVRFRSLSGRLRCDCAQGTDFEVKANTVSGNLEVTGQ